MWTRVLLGVLPLLVFAPMLWGFWVLATRLMDRRLGGRGQTKLLRRALRTGEIPSGAKTTRWLDQSRRVLSKRPHLWVGWVLVVPIVAVNAATIAEDPPSTSAGILFTIISSMVAAAFLVSVFVALPWMTRRRWERLGPRLERASALGRSERQ